MTGGQWDMGLDSAVGKLNSIKLDIIRLDILDYYQIGLNTYK